MNLRTQVHDLSGPTSHGSSWATARARDSKGASAKYTRGRDLATDAAHWPTTKSAGRERPVADDDLPTRVARDIWPTAVVQDAKSAARHTTTTDAMHGGTMLLDAVRAWPTPDTVNRKSVRAMTPSVDNGRRSGGGQSSPPGLEQAAQLAIGEVPHDVPDPMPPRVAGYLGAVRAWPTPRATEGEKGGPNGRGDAGAAVRWPTPKVAADRASERSQRPFPEGYSAGPGLGQAVDLAGGTVPHDVPSPMPPWTAAYYEPGGSWPTPRATEGEKGGPNGRDGSGSAHLCGVAASWATPTTPGGGAMTRSGVRGDELLLPGQAASWSDYPTPSATEYGSSQNGINGKGGEFERPSAGTPSLSTAARQGALPGGKGVLNPIFVEALMGWPLGWTGHGRAGAWPGFPPAPRDTEGWAAYLAFAPETVPACPKDAVEDRIDRLRACGNGVVPQQAAAAFGELFAALGVGHAHSRYTDSGGNGGGGHAVTLRDPRSHASSPSDLGGQRVTPVAPLRGWRNRWRSHG